MWRFNETAQLKLEELKDKQSHREFLLLLVSNNFGTNNGPNTIKLYVMMKGFIIWKGSDFWTYVLPDKYVGEIYARMAKPKTGPKSGHVQSTQTCLVTNLNHHPLENKYFLSK